MDNQKPILVTSTVLANESEAAMPLAPRKEFVEPKVSEPIDIIAATKMFLQITGGGDV